MDFIYSSYLPYLQTIAIVAFCNYEKLSTSTLPLLVTSPCLQRKDRKLPSLTWLKHGIRPSPDFARGLITVLFNGDNGDCFYLGGCSGLHISTLAISCLDKGKDILHFGLILGQSWALLTATPGPTARQYTAWDQTDPAEKNKVKSTNN